MKGSVAPLAAEIMEHPPGQLSESKILTIKAQTPFFPRCLRQFPLRSRPEPALQVALEFWEKVIQMSRKISMLIKLTDTNVQHSHLSLAGIRIPDNPPLKHLWSQQRAM